MSAPNKIHLAGAFRQLELPAGGTIQPGALLQEGPTGVVNHSHIGASAERMFAQEDALQGLAVDTNYTIGNQVSIAYEEPGSLVNALLYPGYNYTGGMFLASHGDGTLYPATGDSSGETQKNVAVVPQQFALNLSASGTITTLNPVRVL